MMVVRLNFAALKQAKPYEYVVRFTLGGLTAVAAGLVADHLGPAMGGLFLAFPAIFAASATLIENTSANVKQGRGCAARNVQRVRPRWTLRVPPGAVLAWRPLGQ
jgi:hypothetical protein